ncbi:MAG: radical SAM protein [Euryarchaeota archaeon]|nr:radical SAM protein [Euryarchaeota archaeon]
MIGCTKLLCGTATVSHAIKYEGVSPGEVPHELLQFSTALKPIVVWNTTRRCNLRCKHCYIKAEDKEFAGELTTGEAKAFIDDLAGYKVPVLLFSGGEPLVRKDFYELGKYAADKGLRTVVSTNGTLITKDAAKKMREAGFKYVGVSLDGLSATHNRFRGQRDAFEKATQGIRNALGAGLNTGVRFTISKYNYKELPQVIDFVVKEKIPRFCMYHLVYAGRGKEIAGSDLSNAERREVMEFLVTKTLELHGKKVPLEILTVDNHADGVYLYRYVKEKEPARAQEVMDLLKMHGGCSACGKVANVDNLGNIHPCQFWGHEILGNVRERKFSEIWSKGEGFMAEMREKPKHLKGKCSVCSYNSICGGCRIRAESVQGDVWAEDPACYLTLDEIKG